MKINLDKEFKFCCPSDDETLIYTRTPSGIILWVEDGEGCSLVGRNSYTPKQVRDNLNDGSWKLVEETE